MTFRHSFGDVPAFVRGHSGVHSGRFRQAFGAFPASVRGRPRPRPPHGDEIRQRRAKTLRKPLIRNGRAIINESWMIPEASSRRRRSGLLGDASTG